MKFLLSNAHKTFYQKYQFIDFDFFQKKEVDQLQYEIEKTNNNFSPSRDLFRRSFFLQSFCMQKKISSLVSSLLNLSLFRLGYDHFFSEKLLPQKKDCLKKRSSVQGILCALMIALKDTKNTPSFLPSQKGHLVFLAPDKYVDFSEIPEKNFYMIVYTNVLSFYTINKKDPYHFFLKKYGYSYGDALKNDTHPMCFFSRH